MSEDIDDFISQMKNGIELSVKLAEVIEDAKQKDKILSLMSVLTACLCEVTDETEKENYMLTLIQSLARNGIIKATKINVDRSEEKMEKEPSSGLH